MNPFRDTSNSYWKKLKHLDNLTVNDIAQTPLVRFVVDLLYHNHKRDRRVDALVVLITSPTALCVVQQIDSSSDRSWYLTLPVTCNNAYMADFMDTFAEFVCWTIPMLHETKTQNAGEFTYFVSDVRGISK